MKWNENVLAAEIKKSLRWATNGGGSGMKSSEKILF